MISGGWGSGKSYFVKNTLLEELKKIEVPKSGLPAQPAAAEKFRRMLETMGSGLLAKYYPVVTSVFGKSDVADIESEIVSNWLDNVSKGCIDKGRDVIQAIGKLLGKSKKVTEWFDFDSILNYQPGINALPRNTVIILDDFERMNVDDSEMLGFVNNISENLGFKVILVCNEEYLDKIGVKLAEFKEKVVEKTLKFKVDVATVLLGITNEYHDEEFFNFMAQDSIKDSYRPDHPLAYEYPQHAAAIANLRSLKFALSHFYSIYQSITKYSRDKKMESNFIQLILLNVWYETLAVTLELKAGRIGCDNLRNLDTDEYVRIAFDPTLTDNRTYDHILLGSNTHNRNSTNDSNSEYIAEFYDFYYVRRQMPWLQPILVPSILKYIVLGIPIDPGLLIQEFQERYDRLNPKDTATNADKMLSEMMQGLSKLSNDNMSDIVNGMVFEVEDKKGEAFTSVENFINAYTYVSMFSDLVSHASAEEIFDYFTTALEDWFAKHDLNTYMKNRIEMMESVLDNSNAKYLYRQVKEKIHEIEDSARKNQLNELLAMFESNTPQFVESISSGLSEDRVYQVPYYANHPILNCIGEDKIMAKVKNIENRDVYALDSLLTNRYLESGPTDLNTIEESFWINLLRYHKEMKDEKTAGRLLFQKLLEPKVLRYFEPDK